MSQELLYTSAPRGLKPGSRGFCTVLSTQGMAAPLATALEGLSGYRPLFAGGDKGDHRNPVVHSHLKLQCAGRVWNVLSRIADYGLDYSQRANKLAHHVLLDKSELFSGGPADLLTSPNVMRAKWEGEPKVVGSKPITRTGSPPTGVCKAWERMTGDAGWAGVVAEAFLQDPDRLVILLFAPGQEILPLFAEAISLLPPERRWDVTFSTYFTGLAPGTTCTWRAMIHDSKEARDSIRFVNALRLDLTAGSCGTAVGGPLVAAARSGSSAVEFGESSDNDEFAEDEFREAEDPQVEFREAESTSANYGNSNRRTGPPAISPPLTLARHVNGPAEPPGQPPRRRRLGDVIEEEANRVPSRRWMWVTLAVVSLMIATSFGAAVLTGKLQVGGSTRASRTVVQALNGGTAPSPKNVQVETPVVVVNSPEPGNLTVPVSQADSANQTSGNATQSTDAATNPDEKTTEKNTEVGNSERPSQVATVANPVTPQLPQPKQIEVLQAKAPVEGKPCVLYEYAWPKDKAVPQVSDMLTFVNALRKNEIEYLNKFVKDFGAEPPLMTLLRPSWINWKVTPPVSGKYAIADIFTEGSISEHSSVIVVIKNSSVKYMLKQKASDEPRMLAWCAFDLRENHNGAVTGRILCSDPVTSLDASQFSKKVTSLAWQSQFPTNELLHPQLHIENVIMAVNGQYCSCSGPDTTWDTAGAYDLELTELRQMFQKEVGIDVGIVPSLTFKAQKENGFLSIRATLSKLYDHEGLMEAVAKRIESEGQSLVRAIPSDLVDLPRLESQIKSLLNAKSKVKGIEDNIQQAIAEAIKVQSQRRNDAKEQNDKKALQEIEDNIKAIPEKLRELEDKAARLRKMEDACKSISIVGIRISYDVCASWPPEQSTKPVRMYVVKVDREDIPASAETGAPK